MALTKLAAKDFMTPAVRLWGPIDYEMYKDFRQQFDNGDQQEIIVIELSTLGGDPEVARMMGEDIRFASQVKPDCRFVFLGKAAIYSAGTTFMSFFQRENRYLTRGTPTHDSRTEAFEATDDRWGFDDVRCDRQGNASRD
jgi:hypothetical protein